VSLRTRVTEAWQKLAGVNAEATRGERKTAMLPSILTPYNAARAGQRATPKPTPANLRKFAETPVARRAINVVKDKIASMDWTVRVRRGYSHADVPDATARMQALRRSLEEPNVSDSFRTLIEQVLEDLLVGGFGAVEMEATGDTARPFHLWAVDGATIEIDPAWDGDAARPRYAQSLCSQPRGLLTAERVPLLDDELMYLRLNPRTHTPFGLGRLEVAFETVNQFLSANRYAGRLASNSVVQYALWLNEATPEQHDRLIRWWQDEIEGTGRVPLLSCEQKPEVLRFAGGTDADLRIQWQEFLLRMIANAFELPPMLLGMQSDVNRSTAGEMADEAFQSAVIPVAKLLAEHITRDLFAKKLGWREFEFSFNDLEMRDAAEEVKMQTELLKAGVLTVDEVREMRGLPKLGTVVAS
jgi:HK97 family phage portal protein